MARVITVLVSSLLFIFLGLLIAWLNVQAQLRATINMTGAAILCNYVFAPLIGAAIGFGLAVLAMKICTLSMSSKLQSLPSETWSPPSRQD